MQQSENDSKQATVIIKEYKKDGSYKLTNHKFIPFSYLMGGATSAKTESFYNAQNQPINKLEFSAKGQFELPQDVNVQGIGTIRATEFRGSDKIRLLNDFGLSERVNDTWTVFSQEQKNSTVDIIFADTTGNPKDVYNYSENDETINISRYKYVNEKDNSYRVKEYKYCANSLALKEEWQGPVADNLSYMVDKDGNKLN